MLDAYSDLIKNSFASSSGPTRASVQETLDLLENKHTEVIYFNMHTVQVDHGRSIIRISPDIYDDIPSQEMSITEFENRLVLFRDSLEQ